MIKYILTVFTSLVFLGCSGQEDDNQNAMQIISMLIDKEAHPLPPPPGDETYKISKSYLDSINNVKLKITLHPTMEGLDFSELPKDIPQQYLQIGGGKFSGSIKDLDGITSAKGHTIIWEDTMSLKRPMEFKDYRWSFTFSKIYYNKDSVRAALILSVSTGGKLSGSSIFIGLKKEDDKWVVDYEKVLEFS